MSLSLASRLSWYSLWKKIYKYIKENHLDARKMAKDIIKHQMDVRTLSWPRRSIKNDKWEEAFLERVACYHLSSILESA